MDPQCSPQLDALPITNDEKRRIAMTVSCHDCDFIPKVEAAGTVVAASPFPYQLMHNGVRVLEHCYYGPWMTELIRLLRGHHEPQEEKVFYELLTHIDAGSTMVELGAFWSYYSLWFQHAVANANNFMVEPDPNNLEVGRKNFAMNGRSGHFINASSGSKSTIGEPFYCESDGSTRSIPRLAVDDLVDQHKINRIELLLADVQGAELKALEGASRTIDAGKLRFVLVSTHHHSISHDPILHQKCLHFLRSRGAYILAEHSVSESYCGDGMIAASFLAIDRAIPEIPISRNTASQSLFPETEFDLAKTYEELDTLRPRLETLTEESVRQADEIGRLTRELADRDRRLASLKGDFSASQADVQSLRQALADLTEKSNQHVAETERLCSELASKQQVIDSILSSKSWRATAILRRIAQPLKRQRS
jgi:FkbM family methyltransferase